MNVVVIVLFDEVDLLDVGGPYEVFLTANRLLRRRGEPALFDVKTVSLEGAPVTSYGGMGLVPHEPIGTTQSADIVIVPGAVALDDALAREDLQAAIHRLVSETPLAASVCVGAFFLGDAGLLAGLPWTTHWEDIPALAERLGSGMGERARWIDAGEVVTAGGLSSGIAMALHLVERFGDRSLAEATATQIDYDWDPDDGVVAG